MSISSILLSACICGDLETIVRNIRAGFNINAPITESGETLLIKSIFYNQYEVVAWLLQNGADPNVKMVNGRTALMTAAGNGSYAIVRWLGTMCDVNIQANNGSTALMYAVARNHDACSVYLISAGANPNLKDSDGWTILDYAQKNNMKAHLNDLFALRDECRLVQQAWSLAVQQKRYNATYNGWPLLVQLAKHGLAAELEYLLAAGVSPSCENPSGTGALNFACKYQHLDCVLRLLEYGADVNRQSRGGRTPLMMAIKYDATGAITEALLNNGANPHIKSSYDGYTAFTFLNEIPNYEPYLSTKRHLEQLLHR